MKLAQDELRVTEHDPKEDFHPFSTIAVLTLLLLFVGASFYVLINSFTSV